jgi:voltage-gated potassium channel
VPRLALFQRSASLRLRRFSSRLPAVVRVLPRAYFLAPLVMMLLVLIGTYGYVLLEDLDPFDGLYLTVMTLTTVGYGDLHPKTTAGQTFTMVLVLGGVFTFFYSAMELIRILFTGEIQELLGKYRMERQLGELQGHLIVCGFGRMGRIVCQEFSQERLPFVVIDTRPAVFDKFEIAHGFPLPGDATSDETLKRAGIDRARGLVTVMASDADNLYATMSARLLNDKLYIVARVEDPNSEKKLLRAGANRVVSPYRIGGGRIVHAVLRPTVVDFIELATKTEHFDLQIEETQVSAGSSLAGTTVLKSGVRSNLKIIIVAIKKAPGHMIFNPAPETLIEAGDILVAIGHREHLDQLDKLADA